VRSETERRELVFALGHEIGNLVAAIRLEAHLLDDAEGAVALARAAMSIEDHSARVGAALAQLRPLLEAVDAPKAGKVELRALFANLRDALAERTRRGLEIEWSEPEEAHAVVGDPERSNALLLLLLLGTLEVLREEGGQRCLRIAAEAAADGVLVVMEDDAPADSELEDWRSAASRGRVLVCQVADAVLEPLGGGVSVSRDAGRTRVALHFVRAEA